MNAELSGGILDEDNLDYHEEVSRVCIIKTPTNYFAVEQDTNNGTDSRHAPGFGQLMHQMSQLGTGSVKLDGTDSMLSGREPKKNMLLMSSSSIQESSTIDTYGDARVSTVRTSMAQRGVEVTRNAVYVIGNITPSELEQLESAQDHVLTVAKWILFEVSQHQISGRLLIAPPILSRVYQELSNGMLAFFMAKSKISMVPFPFAFAQVVSYALLFFYLFCPFIILEVMKDVSEDEDSQVEHIGVPVLLNFAACMGYAAVNEIAIEMEEPFGFDINDYPVHCQQSLIVRAMEDTFYCQAPTDFTLALFEGHTSHSPEVSEPGEDRTSV